MRYRALDANGDMTFGLGPQNFFVNSPATVAQAILTRLKLFEGEWFLDVTEGTPYFQQIIGTNTQGTRDVAIRERILGTPGVNKILSYASFFNPATRTFSVSATVDTIYGATTVTI